MFSDLVTWSIENIEFKVSPLVTPSTHAETSEATVILAADRVLIPEVASL